MRILLIRHGEPDYVHDVLTQKGQREAQLLSRQLVREHIEDFYLSPLVRAQETALPTLQACGKEGETLPWLREFTTALDLNKYPEFRSFFPDSAPAPDGSYIRPILWDMIPAALVSDPSYLSTDNWKNSPLVRKTDAYDRYTQVGRGLDEILARYGYERDGQLYRTAQGTDKTIAFFCHFGVTCVMLSWLFNISPFLLWHRTVSLTTSVTEINSEEREKGIVNFRLSRFGDISHLTAAGEQPSFCARFCSVYENKDERH